MIKCPNCGKVSADIHYKGPILFVEGTAVINSSGVITALGPARAIITVAAGKEMDSLYITFVCNSCKYEGAKDTFILVRQCVISGKEATVEFKTPFGSIWIADGLNEEAARIFSDVNANWIVELPEELFHV